MPSFCCGIIFLKEDRIERLDLGNRLVCMYVSRPFTNIYKMDGESVNRNCCSLNHKFLVFQSLYEMITFVTLKALILVSNLSKASSSAYCTPFLPLAKQTQISKSTKATKSPRVRKTKGKSTFFFNFGHFCN